MAKVVGDIAVVVGADVTGLEAGMKRSGRAVKKFDGDAAAMGRRMAKIGIGITAVATAIGVAFVRSSINVAKSAKEIKNLSTIAGVSAVEFQKLAAGADSVSISQEKLADLFKDTNDKFGDFMANGAGPLKDFFDNIAPAVGVTADQFARLSGPEAMQLYVSSLEKAGLSQQQMTFYMEALASDATALIPLLADNGREMKRLGDAAEDTGRIISDDLIDEGAELDRALKDLSDTLSTRAKTALLEYGDKIVAAADFINLKLLPAVDEINTAIVDFAQKMAPAVTALEQFVRLGRIAMGMDVSTETGAVPSAEDQDREDAAMDELAEGDPVSTTGIWTLLPEDDPSFIGPTRDTGTVKEFGIGEVVPVVPGITGPVVPPLVSPVTSPTKPAGSSRGGGGGGGGGLNGEDFTDFKLDMLQENLASQTEMLDLWREEQLEKLREFREAKLGTDEEFNALEAQINSEHSAALVEIERRAQQERLSAVSGAFGNLASLMASENDKIFKIGKAAALAEAVINGYSAAVSAWDKGMKIGGPPLAAAFTAGSLARTGSLIAGISSASAKGSGGGAVGGGGGGGSPVAAAAPSPLALTLEGINPTDLYSGSTITGLFERLQDEAQDRGFTVSFT